MKDYTAYELTIRSAFDIPELQPLDDAVASPDVIIREGTVDPVPESVDGKGIERIQATPGECRLSYDSYGSFLVESGERVTIDPASPAVVGTKKFLQLLENQIMAVVLHQRGHLVLHASAVAVDGSAAVFLGPRGAGKSTTAAAFEANGYHVLEDDVVAIRFDDGTPTVLPGIPQLRLTGDAANGLGLEDAVEPTESGWTDKYHQRLDELPGATPLRACYLLRDGESVALEELPGHDPLFELISHTYAGGLLADTDSNSEHFQQCSTILDQVAFKELRRPVDLDRLPELVTAVVDDV
jgi:hypothetical protein